MSNESQVDNQINKNICCMISQVFTDEVIFLP